MNERPKPSGPQIDVKKLLRETQPHSLAELVVPQPFLRARNLSLSFSKDILLIGGQVAVYAHLSIGHSRNFRVDIRWALKPFKQEFGEPVIRFEDEVTWVEPQGTVHHFFWKLDEKPPV